MIDLAAAWRTRRRDPDAEAENLDRIHRGHALVPGSFMAFSVDDRGSALEYRMAHSGLALINPGDTSVLLLAEVKQLVRRGSARVQR